jgi:hypothetical protein
MAGRFAAVTGTALGIAAALLLGGCANRPPVALSSQFSPPSRHAWPAAPRGSDVKPSCRVRVAEIRDLRTDPEAMGSTGRLIRSSDTTAWVRSGFASLARDWRLTLIDDAAPSASDLVLAVDVVKAYAMSVTGETRAASVVVRVHYSRNGAPDGEQVYRGTENGVNWANGEGETQASFDAALAELLADVDRDLLARCNRT